MKRSQPIILRLRRPGRTPTSTLYTKIATSRGDVVTGYARFFEDGHLDDSVNALFLIDGDLTEDEIADRLELKLDAKEPQRQRNDFARPPKRPRGPA